MITDNRYYSRISFVAEAEVFVDAMCHSAKMLDLSLRGILLDIQSAEAVDIGLSYPIKIHLPSSDTILRFDAEVVHKNDTYAGFKFLSLDVESMTHLRKILDFNTGDHAKSSSEMEFWLSQ